MTHTDQPLPPNRAGVETERRQHEQPALHTMSPRELVDRFNESNLDVDQALREAAPKIALLIQAAEPGFLNGGRLIYIGAGTSGRLGVLDASEIPPTFQMPNDRVIGIIAGGDRSLRQSSESREDERDGVLEELKSLQLGKHDTLVGIAAGGTTPYVLGGLEYARSLSAAPVTALVCCSLPPAHEQIDHVVYLPTGPEVVTGSTRMKAGTATKLALNAISTGLMIRTGRVYQDLMVDLRATNDKLKDRAARIVSELTDIDRDSAFELLSSAEGNVKAAVVMQSLGTDYASAQSLLTQNAGRLDRALGQGSELKQHSSDE